MIESAVSTDYVLSINANLISFTTTINQLTISSFTIKSLITPSESPSLPIYMTISLMVNSQAYLIAKSSNIYWSLACSLPCKTCIIGNPSSCLSCYNDSSIVADKILYYPNNSCLSQCGDQYYANSTDDKCYSCINSCYNCINYNQCTSCPTSSYLLIANYTCFQNVCPIGYFIYYQTCKLCTSSLNCQSCSNSVSCDSCISGYYFY